MHNAVVKPDPHFHFYRNMAHSYFYSAKALWEKFGEDESIPGSIRLTINPTPQQKICDSLLLLPHPFHYLVAQSLELYMKGYLCCKGMETSELKKIRHNLSKLMRKCEEKEFWFNEDEKKYVVEVINTLNDKGHILRYPSVGTFSMVNFHGASILLKRFDRFLLDHMCVQEF